MISPRQIFAAMIAVVVLASCGGFEHYDARNPTVSQQDAYDVSWGLPPRKSRGTPKLRYQYDARREMSAPMSAAPPEAAPAAPAPVASSPAPAPEPISPTIPSNLR